MADPKGDEYKNTKPIKIISSIPIKRINLLSWNGWGYKDSGFIANSNENRTLIFSGERYPIKQKELTLFISWFTKKFGLTDLHLKPREGIPTNYRCQPSKLTTYQLNRFKSLNIKLTLDNEERLHRSHGQGLYEILNVRNNTLKRIADLVVWPTCHEDVVAIVTLASELNVVIIPFGGGSSDSGASEYPPGEDRPIIALDTTLMNSILWINDIDSTICCQSGVIGQDLEAELQKNGYTCGHEPDSIEFSTLGGWIAMAASGMKRNKYGGIKDIVLNARLVTPVGVIEETCYAPITFESPNVNQIVFGSEGSYGVITDVVIKVRPAPRYQRFGSFVFSNYENAVKCLQNIALQRFQPSSIRLVDNERFELEKSLVAESDYYQSVIDNFRAINLKNNKFIDPGKICVATVRYEGDLDEIDEQTEKVSNIVLSYGGISGGEENGKSGYNMIFNIAYLLDLAMDCGLYAESIETTVSWDIVSQIVHSVKSEIATACKRIGVSHHLTMVQVTQCYDIGCCLYFNILFNGKGLHEPLKIKHDLDKVARDTIIGMGGSISHHRGSGKVRSKESEPPADPAGLNLFKIAKNSLDPKNIFNTMNFVPGKDFSKL